jgi:hypothetical protein
VEEELLVPEIDRQLAEGRRVPFRADAAFARPAIFEALETRRVGYPVRIPANKNLELATGRRLSRCTAGPGEEKTQDWRTFREMSSGARSRRQRMSTGAQVRWRIMRLINDGQIGNVSGRLNQSSTLMRGLGTGGDALAPRFDHNLTEAQQ